MDLRDAREPIFWSNQPHQSGRRPKAPVCHLAELDYIDAGKGNSRSEPNAATSCSCGEFLALDGFVRHDRFFRVLDEVRRAG
jgi:hypothetical protein